MGESLSEGGEDELLEICWQDARELVTSADPIQKELFRARLKMRLGALSGEDRARFVERLEVRGGGLEQWGLAAKREEMLRVLRDAVGKQ